MLIAATYDSFRKYRPFSSFLPFVNLSHCAHHASCSRQRVLYAFADSRAYAHACCAESFALSCRAENVISTFSPSLGRRSASELTSQPALETENSFAKACYKYSESAAQIITIYRKQGKKERKKGSIESFVVETAATVTPAPAASQSR